jgi:subtilisin family serine protease
MNREPDLTKHFAFVPGDLVFVAEHVTGMNSDTLHASLMETYPDLGNRLGLVDHARTLTFDPLENRETPAPPSGDTQRPSLSFLYANLEDMPDADLVELVLELWETLSPPEEQAADEAETVDEPARNVRLLAVTPNWLMASAPFEPPGPPDMGGGGGPGTRPVEAHIKPRYYLSSLLESGAPWNFSVDSESAPETLTQLQARFPSLTGAEAQSIMQAANTLRAALGSRETAGEPVNPVEVVILDTAPPVVPPTTGAHCLSLSEAYTKWQAKHPLLRSLLAPNGTLPSGHLRITHQPAYDGPDPDDSAQPGEFNLARSRPDGYPHYFMDHGLFVAGIIHTLAPQAKLHLIEVLNARGFGSFEIIANGIKEARLTLQSNPNATLLVNMSLTFSFPWFMENIDEDTLDAVADFLRLVEIIESIPGLEKYLAQGMQKLCDLLGADQAADEATLLGLIAADEAGDEATQLAALGAKVVAASGNDRKHNAKLPKARLPAAFSSVIGVGALNHVGLAAIYTNEADRPPRQGVVVFGGDEDANQPGWADDEHGMLGIYIGDFPHLSNPIDPEQTLSNDTGWARWGGTSFAAPVVTGCLALLISQGMSPGEAVHTVQLAFWELDETQPHQLPIKQG